MSKLILKSTSAEGGYHLVVLAAMVTRFVGDAKAETCINYTENADNEGTLEINLDSVIMSSIVLSHAMTLLDWKELKETLEEDLFEMTLKLAAQNIRLVPN